MHTHDPMSAWFAGPKGENAEAVVARLRRIADDYYAWRRNYFAEDGVVIGSADRRANEAFDDAFEDRLTELLGRLKEDVPFHSPRYAAHMLAEQTLPSIVGYFAAMLYNPNNVSSDVAPVTIRLEHQVGGMLAKMIGYDEGAWSHLCSGGTVANIEALWVARSTRYLALAVRDARAALGLSPPHAPGDADLMRLSPGAALDALERLFIDARAAAGEEGVRGADEALRASVYNPTEAGMPAVVARLGSEPVLLAPETCHYCFEKALDVLGLGRRALRLVRVDEHFRMIPDELRAALDHLDAQGRHALAVVGVVGSTEEGSIDPLDAIHTVRTQRERVGLGSFWLHADGAYGGYLRSITVPARAGLGEPRAAVRVRGREREIGIDLPGAGACAALEAMAVCDSVTIDPHKLGYVPYPGGAVCFRHGAVRTLTRQAAPYLEDAAPDPAHDRASESIGVYVLEGSKPGAAAAAAWLSHSLIPLDTSGHGRLMRENIRNACELAALLERYPALTADEGAGGAGGMGVRAVTLCPPGSNIVCYAFRPAAPTALARINLLNRGIFKRFSVRQGARVHNLPFFVSRTVLSAARYSERTVRGMLDRLGVDAAQYQREGVVLLRSVLMNPWYAQSKRRGRYLLCELVDALYAVAEKLAHGHGGGPVMW
ncbi:MAG: aspartate aminotransferase family protein [Phycisphaerales bacterium]